MVEGIKNQDFATDMRAILSMNLERMPSGWNDTGEAGMRAKNRRRAKLTNDDLLWGFPHSQLQPAEAPKSHHRVQ